MKKLLVILAILVLSSSFSFAEKKPLLTLDKTREMARSNIYGKKKYENKIKTLKDVTEEYGYRYGSRYESTDVLGNRTYKWIWGPVDTDPVSENEKFKKSLDEIKDINEKQSIDEFFKVVYAKNLLKKAKNDAELLKLVSKAEEVSVKLGSSVKLSSDKAKTNEKAAELSVKQKTTDLKRAYEDLNKTIGFRNDVEYEIDTESAVLKIQEGTSIINVPSNLDKDKINKLKDLKDAYDELERKKYADENLIYSNVAIEDMEDYRKEIDYQMLKKEYDEKKDALLKELKKGYIDNISDFMELDKNKKELDIKKKTLENERLKFSLGKIDKISLIKEENEYLELEKEYYKAIYELYIAVYNYNKQYEEAKNYEQK